jgi:hypothetical protein
MILGEEEEEKNRGTNCLCHSTKTAHTQISRKEKKTKKSADDPIIGN